MKVYRIIDKDGNVVSGKRRSLFTSKGHIKNSIIQDLKNYYSDGEIKYKDCKVVEYTLQPTGNEETVEDMMSYLKETK